ncbi:MAG: exosortase H-associated membrane protein [Gammaproteobacteria bacterium]
MLRNSGIASLVFRTTLWLPLCFLIWYVAADLLLAPIEWLSSILLSAVLPGSLADAQLEQGSILFDTHYRIHAADGRIGEASFAISALNYTYNLPVIAALSIAVSRWQTIARRISLSYLLLLPLWLWGVVFHFIKTVATGLGPEISAAVGIHGLPLEAVALSYQFGYLMMPNIAVPLVWLYVCRDEIPLLLRDVINWSPSSVGSNEATSSTKETLSNPKEPNKKRKKKKSR